jgi:hypothetical protein
MSSPLRGNVVLDLLGRLLRNRNVVMAVLIALVSSVVLLAYRNANPGQGAEHYYMRENHSMYRVMQVCYVVIMASIGFNLRFVVFEAFTATVLTAKALR